MTVSSQAKTIRDALQQWIDTEKGKAAVVTDLLNLWEVAYQATQWPRALVCYHGEDLRGDFAEAAALGRVDRRWLVAIIRGTGFNASRGNGLTDTEGNARPFYDQVEEARDLIRCLRSISVELPVDYKRIYPMEKLDDFISGYIIEFTTANDLPTMSLETPTLYFTNTEQSYTASCDEGYVENSETATVAAGTHISLNSQEEADAAALAEAQSTAEAALVCVWPELVIELPNGSQINSTTWNTIASDEDTLVTSYNETKQVTIRLRGIAESKVYTGGTTENGWRVGGSPAATNFNYYRLTVSSPAQTYYLNDEAVQAGGTSARIWDYENTITVDAGATLTLTGVSVDSVQLGSEGKEVDEDPPELPIEQPYNGQFFVVQIIDVT